MVQSNILPLSSDDTRETLVGTSFCEQTKCIECISRLRCSFTFLSKNLEIVAEAIGSSKEELFPALAFHKLVVEGS